MEFLKPPALRPGDRVRVIAPGGPFDRESFDAGLAVLAKRYRPTFHQDLFTARRYLAGDDHRRAEELASAIADPETRAIFCARGGYGAMRLLPSLSLQHAPLKALVGFSDVTALHLAFQAAGRISFHGPVVTQLGKQPHESAQRLFAVLESTGPAPALEGATSLVAGDAEGPLIGGNLSVLTRLLGTPFLPNLEGAVLLLEDVGERPYRLDRMWTHLALAGVFHRISGIVLGTFTRCEEKGERYTSTDVLRELAGATGLPCASGFAIGHGEANLAVPLGCRVRLDATRGQLKFLERAMTPTGAGT